MLPPGTTHYCDWDAPGTLWCRALCGLHIQRREHKNTPTCPICVAALAQRAADDQAGVSPDAAKTRAAH
jgi:hypothetical protein